MGYLDFVADSVAKLVLFVRGMPNGEKGVVGDVLEGQAV